MALSPVKPFSEGRSTYETARIILLGIPLDVTVSSRPGTRFAPSAIRESSWSLEDYNYLTDEDILEVPFFDLGDLILKGDLNDGLNEIRRAIREILKDKKAPVSIGGEHLITLPIIQAMKEVYPDLQVMIFDAHADLSDSFRKMPLSHANVLKGVYDIVGGSNMYLFGTRAGTKGDKELIKKEIFSSYRPPLTTAIEELKGGLKNKPIYISIDMDILDPSSAPGVTTPEVLGWGYEQLYETMRGFSGLKIVGADLTEISPHYDIAGTTSLAGASLVREILFLLARSL
ncbi:TPA: agmatinase [bacterium]|nr:agmatinase [bacterium]